MAKGIYFGIGGKARKVKALYIGIGGKARKIKKAYIGIGGKARLFYTAKGYTVTLSGISDYGFESSTVTNPDATLYDGVYQSNNKGKHSTNSVMKITFTGYTTFTVYIRSYAEGNYDYTIASTLDASSYPTAYNTSGLVQAHTRGSQKSGTAITNYTAATYNTDGGEHFIYVVYRKDSSTSSNDDRGYVLIKKD